MTGPSTRGGLVLPRISANGNDTPVEDRLSRIMSCTLYPSPRIPDVFSHVGSNIGLWIQSDKYARILFFLDINSISIIIGASPM